MSFYQSFLLSNVYQVHPPDANLIVWFIYVLYMSTSSLPPVSSLNISCDQGRVSSSCHPSLCADCADRRKVSQLSRKGSWADQFTGLTRRVKVSRLTLAPVPQGRIFFLGCNDFGSKKYSFCQKIDKQWKNCNFLSHFQSFWQIFSPAQLLPLAIDSACHPQYYDRAFYIRTVHQPAARSSLVITPSEMRQRNQILIFFSFIADKDQKSLFQYLEFLPLYDVIAIKTFFYSPDSQISMLKVLFWCQYLQWSCHATDTGPLPVFSLLTHKYLQFTIFQRTAKHSNAFQSFTISQSFE